MTQTLRLTRITCPACRTALDGLDLCVDLRRLCPYCGTSFVLSAENMDSAHEMPLPDRVIPFATDRKDFEREVLKSLAANDRTPLAIFDSMNFVDAEGLYYPAWYFEGEYRVRGAEAPAQPRRRLFASREKEAGGIPIGVLCPAGDPEAVLPQMTERLDSFLDLIPQATPYSSQTVRMTMFIPVFEDENSTWASLGQRMFMSKSAEQAGLEEIEIGTKITSRLVLVPFWLATFRYAGHCYRFIMDGAGAGTLHALLPEQERYEKPHRILRQAADSLMVAAWLSLVLLFWNVWQIPAVMWGLWLVTFMAVHIQRAVFRKRAKRIQSGNSR